MGAEGKLSKEELLEMLRAEVARLLCADDVSEDEKLLLPPVNIRI
jgi:hypothetical protein